MFARVYWLLPAVSALAWLGTLLGLLLNWVAMGKPYLPSYNPGQNIAYISDTGAFRLKPLFIAGGAVTVIFLDLSLVAERWLRHTGRLAPNTTWFQKLLSCIGILASIAGAAGLILLSCFDTYRHSSLHTKFLALFIVGYVVSAIFVAWEFWRLEHKYTRHPILKVSFYMKVIFIVIEIALAIPFAIYENEESDTHINTAAILEWAIAFIFVFYVLSYIVDLLPAVRHHERMSHPGFAEMGMLDKVTNGHANGEGYATGNAADTNGNAGYTNGNAGYTNGNAAYTNGNAAYSNGNTGYTNGYVNGNGAASQNF